MHSRRLLVWQCLPETHPRKLKAAFPVLHIRYITWVLFALFFEMGSDVAQAVLKLDMEPGMALDPQPLVSFFRVLVLDVFLSET